LRITFVVERPTQFEAPFFRHAAQDARHELRVLFTNSSPAAPIFDPELGMPVSWGIDLLGGYPQAVAPARGRARWLARELRRGSPDLLIVNGYTRREYLLAAMLARRAGIPTALRLDSVLWDHAARVPWANRFVVSAMLPRLYDLFLAVGSLTLEFLAACGVPAARRGLFPYAIDVEQFRAASRLSPDERAAARVRLDLAPGDRVVLAVAKLNPREAPRDLLHALPSLPPEVRVLVAGDGPERGQLERLAANLAPGRARFLGYIPYARLPALYAAADLFVHAAREERWGVSVAEALACGLPVVSSSRVGAGYDLVESGRNGWRYSAGDPGELARRIGEALDLDRLAVAAVSRGVLARWDYAASWRHLLDAAGRIVAGSTP
jgi:glycosyltransferase involved in cell wall biosynthesis